MRIAGAAGIIALAGSLHAFQAARQAKDISVERLREHLRILASDEYEGRGPGTRAERLTVDYLTRQFKSYGLRGANPDGTYEQPVPLVSSMVRLTGVLATSKISRPLVQGQDFWTLPTTTAPAGDSNLRPASVVFAGYGMTAPEYGWDDYASVDVRGKFAVVLSGTPPPRLTPAGTARAWSSFGNRNVKINTARQHGALGVLVVFEATPAAPTAEHTLGRAMRELATNVTNAPARPADPFAAVLIAPGLFAEMAAGASRDVRALTTAAAQAPAKTIELGNLAVHLTRNDRAFPSSNVVAVQPGSDPARRDEVIIYTGHWDHLGRDANRSGDQIFNGAVDNAGGVAQLLEIARAFSRRSPKRTVLFIVTTAEEEGLIGANYYVAHPLFPLRQTIADINLDGFWPFGELRDLVEFGAGNTTLDDLVASTSAALNRRVVPDPMPEERFFQRSDHWPFALAGVPVIFPSGWPTPHPEDPNWRDPVKAYLTDDYHRVSDEYHSSWDLLGAADDAQWMLEAGWRLTQSGDIPTWKATAPCQPCKAKGDALRQKK